MIKDVQSRFITSRKQTAACREEASVDGMCEGIILGDSIPFDNDESTKMFLTDTSMDISIQRALFGQWGNGTGLVFGDFNLEKDADGSVSALISGRMA